MISKSYLIEEAGKYVDAKLYLASLMARQMIDQEDAEKALEVLTERQRAIETLERKYER